MQDQKKVLIVGAGLTGLATAKFALEAGLVPVVIEKKSGIGGVWNVEEGNAWENMTTNICKYNASFSDFPWPEGASVFPTGTEFYHYIERYAENFKLNAHITFNCEVIRIIKKEK